MTTGTSIQLIPVRKSGQFDHWEMSVGNQPAQGPPYPHLSVAKGDAANFIFTIDNPQGIQFQPNNPGHSSPIYIQPGTQKPTSGVNGVSGIVVGDSNSGAKNAKLTIHDGNKDAGTLTYVLNFTGAPQLDPIIDNTGGGPGNYYAWYVGGAVLLLAVLWFVLRPVFRRPQPVEKDTPTA